MTQDSYYDFERVYQAVVNQLVSRSSTAPLVLVEVGCFKGASVIDLGRKLLGYSSSFELYAVDTWCSLPYEKFDADANFAEFWKYVVAAGLDKNIYPIRRDSVSAAALFESRVLDMVFLDGDHTFDGLKADLQAWHPKLKSDGVFAGHDADWGEVNLALKAYFTSPGRQGFFFRYERCWSATTLPYVR